MKQTRHRAVWQPTLVASVVASLCVTATADAPDDHQQSRFSMPGQGYEHLDPVRPGEPGGQGFFYNTPMAPLHDPPEESPPEPSEPDPDPEPEIVHEEIQDPPPTPLPEPEAPIASEPSDPDVGSAEWIRINLEFYRERALDDPSDLDAVRAYAYLDRLMQERSLQFAESFRTVQFTDPLLQRDYGPAGRDTRAMRSRTAEQQRRTREIWADAAQDYGLLFFVQRDCSYCDFQAPILEVVANDRGLDVLQVSVDGMPPEIDLFDSWRNPGLAEELGVTTIPAIFLVNTETMDYRLVAFGSHPKTDLERRLTLIAYTEGALTREQYEETQFAFRNNGNSLSERLERASSDLSPAGSEIDPSDLIEQLQNQLGER